MDAFVGAHSRVRRLKMSLIVQYTYKFTKHTSPMRRLLVDMYANCSQSTDVMNVSLRELPAEFDEDVFQALNEPRETRSRNWWERLENPSVYHV